MHDWAFRKELKGGYLSGANREAVVSIKRDKHGGPPGFAFTMAMNDERYHFLEVGTIELLDGEQGLTTIGAVELNLRKFDRCPDAQASARGVSRAEHSLEARKRDRTADLGIGRNGLLEYARSDDASAHP